MPVDHRAAIALVGHVEEDYFPLRRIAQHVQFVEGTHHHDIGREPAFRCAYAAAETQEVDPVRGRQEQLSRFPPSHPAGHHHRLSMNVREASGLHPALGPGDGLVQLGRTRQPVSNSITEPGEVRVGALGAEGFGLHALGGLAKGLRRGLREEAGGGEEGREAAARIHASSYLVTMREQGFFTGP